MTYRDVRYTDELQYSVYNFEAAHVPTLWKLFEIHEGEARRLIDLYADSTEKARYPVTRRPTITCSSAAISLIRSMRAVRSASRSELA